jgi:hypothetical protein
MKARTVHRLRYALRLCASVFALSTPCGGHPVSPSMSVTVEALAPATDCPATPGATSAFHPRC